MTTIRLHNTRTRKKEDFVPLNPDNVRMYVCGPTVYDRAHLGNARPVVVFDVLYRLLRHVYGAEHVTYVRNFTDVDDKINDAALARKQAGDPRSLEALIRERTDETIAWYHADMDALGALRPGHEPRATEFIPQMVAMIDELVRKGVAYVVPATIGHNSRAQYVYLDSTRIPSHTFLSVQAFADHPTGYRYGELSGRSVEDMIAGSRSEVGEGKRSPMDSVLWKPSTIDLPGWKSPWGFGRPGWHIECSAMSRKLLGKQFDIHGGGLDLLFPHHENELAQCAACDGVESSARYWLHNEMLQVEGKKMSKSLGNFFTVRDLLDQGVPGEVIRFVMLSTHYSKPMDWTVEKEAAARVELAKWRTVTDAVAASHPDAAFVEALANDLNTFGAITVLRRLFRSGDHSGLKSAAALMGLLTAEMMWDYKRHYVFHVDPRQLNAIGGKVALKISQARAAKDFVASDKLRDAALASGFKVNISKDAVTLEPTAEADPAKLESLL